MNALLLLLSLLVAAYFGAILTSGRTIRGFGLPSGAEWILAGVALGPGVLGVFDGSTISEFQPLVLLGLGWVGMVIGIDYGYVGERRIRMRGILSGIALSILAALAVFGAVWLLGRYVFAWPADELGLIAGGISLVSAETTRHAVRWASERYDARGPLIERLGDIGDADDLVPLLGLVALMVWAPRPELSVDVNAAVWMLATCLLGALLGALAASLLARSTAFGETWAVLLGTCALLSGVTTRLGLASISALFLAGMTMCAISHRHTELREVLAPTERPVMLPLLLLGGASIELSGWSLPVVALLGCAFGVRLLVKLASGWLAQGQLAKHAVSSFTVGASLMSCGTLTMCIGLVCYLKLPAPAGKIVLMAATANALLGELIGPGALRRALSRAGELPEPTAPVDIFPTTQSEHP